MAEWSATMLCADIKGITLGEDHVQQHAAYLASWMQALKDDKGAIFRVATAAPEAAPDVPNTMQLGQLLYSEYLYPVEIAAAILLVAMIAAIALTLRARKDSKYVSPGDQVRVKAADRITVLKMSASQVAPAPVVEDAVQTETKA